MWSGLLGAAAIVGAYESVYTNAPSQFLTESPAAATTVLLAVALGFLATNLLAPQGESSTEPARTMRDDASDATLDELVAGGAK